MPEELLFTVSGSTATPAETITLGDAGLKERSDLQEWVLAHPRMLGSTVMVVTFEFDQWWSSSGEHQLDRLDVLGLDDDGTLVVAELKRDRAPDVTEMQAIKYAAMASRFTVEALASQHARFLAGRGTPCTDGEALERLTEHAPDLAAETLRRPRIVLLAADYPPVVTATTVWLTEMGLDLTLMKFQAYRTSTEVLVSVSQLYPVPDVEEFTVTPRQAEVRAAQETRKRIQDVSAVRRLVDADAIEDGAEFTLSVGTQVGPDIRAAIIEWVDADERRTRATWQNKAAAPLVWAYDEREYSPSGLAKLIISNASGVERQIQGTRWWVNDEGRDLVMLSAELGGNAHLYAEFWSAFLDRLRIEHPDWIRTSVPPGHNWFELSAPIRGAHYSVSFARGRQLRSELYIDTGENESTAALFASIEQPKTSVESAYGSPLSWEPLPNRRACRVADYDVGEIALLDAHDRYLDWFIDTQMRLRSSLEPVLKALGPGGDPSASTLPPSS